MKNRRFSALCAVLMICFSALSIARRDAVFTSADTGNVQLPIVMYHMVLDDEKRLGKFVISPDELESDMKYLKACGYESVVFSDLADYAENGGKLPDKPIMITFDDGYYNNFLFAYPILKKYGFKAVLSVIGIQSEAYSESGERSKYYSHMTWEDIKQSTDVFEIQSHSYNLHSLDGGRRGAKKKNGEGSAQYKTVLSEDLRKNEDLIKKNTGCEVTAFAYPFGAMCSEAHEVTEERGYKGSLSCEEGINVIVRDKKSLFGLRRYNRPSGRTSEEFFKFAG